MKTPDMDKENNFVLREAAKAAQMGYYDHLAAGGKGDPAEERWIEALTAGADAISKVHVLETQIAKGEPCCSVCAYNFTGDGSCKDYIRKLESRLAQVERERDAAVKDLYAHDKCLVCKQELFGDGSYIQNACFDCMKWCNFKWRGVCAENSKEEN